MIHQKKFKILLIIGVCAISFFGIVSCRNIKTPESLNPEQFSIQQTRISNQMQTNQARILQTKGLWQPESQNTLSLPTTEAIELILTSTQKVTNTAVTALEPSKTSPLYPGTEQVTPTRSLPNTTLTPSNTLSPTNTFIVTLTYTSTLLPTNQSSLTLTPTKTQSPTPTPTLTRTLTPTHTPSPTLQTGWGGEWIINFEISEGSYTSSILSLTLNGSNFTAQAEIGNKTYEFTGYIYNNETYATGSWTTPTDSGSFWWMLPADGKFAGSWDNHYGFCGKRESASFPDPCKKLPPR